MIYRLAMGFLVLLGLSTTLHAEDLSCHLIKTYQSCTFTPGCRYLFSSDISSCVGKIKILPRYIHEFIHDTHNVFSIETVLAVGDLERLALHRKSLAKYINKHKIKDSWILNEPQMAVSENSENARELLAKYRKFGIAIDRLGTYPSAGALFSQETQISKLSSDLNIPVSTLLKLDQSQFFSLIYDSTLVEKLKILGISGDSLVSHKKSAVPRCRVWQYLIQVDRAAHS